ncbi:2-oxo-4-hydroxy-4-carboxy-5-ureidoimidazoline decarboxylase [Evansella sp. AB-P1]|uniref:2-oxo-4-hydroxy-4-carboxy-5-ureidoimidazoline decarboxylase n=1 Tax=Evansella sp. AB-P1 TaxID=3037653 RepID=UPI00241C0ECD|nr:2-oxo-4-hydroxy-4-carboxy-5-ureidoimidazoline decarboxylase [Evansella sp. AB-P1]MDG5787906.1 2-oxo-4-hydroxy-4-carboxy-5-ureidoimidazoline decarboxylase [Evansella sp. AB-P1]
MLDINRMERHEFINKIGLVFEHSPWVAEVSWYLHPFESFEEMYNGMIEEMYNANTSLKLSLLRAHPDLGTKFDLSASSKEEQKSAGLNELTEEEFKEFTKLNRMYVEKFGFPFILAVKGKGKEEIKLQMRTRITNSYEKELETALSEVSKIARFRLFDLVKGVIPS